MPFVSDADAKAALEDAGVTGDEATAIVDENQKARLGALRAALAVLALVAALGAVLRRRHPDPAAGVRAAGRGRGQPDLAPAEA